MKIAVYLTAIAAAFFAPTVEAACPFHMSGKMNEAAIEAHSAFHAAHAELDAGYQALPAQLKFGMIRGNLTATPKSGSWPNIIDKAGLFTESMAVTMDNESDEFPKSTFFQRKKLIHSVGYVAEVKINWQPNPYTGLFQRADLGFLRLASAVEPDYTKASALEGGFTPGFGMKFVRDGVHSGNFVTLHQLMPQDSWNAFKYPYSNHVTLSGLSDLLNKLADKFATAPSAWAGYVGLSDFARYGQNGARASDAELNFPFQLIFYPDPTLQTAFPDAGTGHDLFVTQLSTLKPGQRLFSVYAKASYSAPQTKIGDVMMASAFAPSGYGDNTMFVQHTRFDDDIKLRPASFLGACTDIHTCKVCPLETTC